MKYGVALLVACRIVMRGYLGGRIGRRRLADVAVVGGCNIARAVPETCRTAALGSNGVDNVLHSVTLACAFER